MVGAVLALQIRFDVRQHLLPDVRRVADHGVEPARGEHLGEGRPPVERPRVDGRVGDDAVPGADRVVEARQHLSPRRRLDPQAEFTDLDGLFVEVHPVQVVLKDLPVEVEQRPVPAEFFQPVVRREVRGVELVEGFDQERPAAARRVEDADRGEFVLPRLPEADQGVPLRVVQ